MISITKNYKIKQKTIGNIHKVDLDTVTGSIILDDVHFAYITDIEISKEYSNIYVTFEDKVKLFKELVLCKKKPFSISIDIREITYYKAKGMVISAENDAFPIFELQFPTYQ